MEKTKSKQPPDDIYPLHPAEPQKMPEPTLWHFMAALGTLFIFWGIIASVFIIVIGFIILGISIAGWIEDLNYE
jgi:hypothetical protein